MTTWLNRTFGALHAALGSGTALRRFTLASLVANIVLVVTGGAVRLTGSGLGCPTWPECDGGSYVTTRAMGYHGVIEFGNRTLTFVVTVLALASLISVWFTARTAARRTRMVWAWLVVGGIPAQAVLGGITVLTHLNPWVVAAHFLLSCALIAAAYQLWVRSRADDFGRAPLSPGMRTLAWVIVWVAAAVLAAGTVVTGSGPHAGDEHAKRTGLDPATVAQFHADLVMLLIGLSVAAWLALRASGGATFLAFRAARSGAGVPAGAVRAARNLVIIECAQGLIGFVQYFTHLPVVLVGAHMLGACLVWVGALALLTAVGGVRVRDARAVLPQSGTEEDAAAAPTGAPHPAHETVSTTSSLA